MHVHTQAGLDLKWKSSDMEKSGCNKFFSSFFVSCVHEGWRKGEKTSSCSQSIFSPKDEGWSFDVALESPVWRISEGETEWFWEFWNVVSFIKPWLGNHSKVFWLTKSSLVHPQTQTFAAKLNQKSGLPYSAFHPQTRTPHPLRAKMSWLSWPPTTSGQAVHCTSISHWDHSVPIQAPQGQILYIDVLRG